MAEESEDKSLSDLGRLLAEIHKDGLPRPSFAALKAAKLVDLNGNVVEFRKPVSPKDPVKLSEVAKRIMRRPVRKKNHTVPGRG